MALSIDAACWAVNGANVAIPSTWACMCQNLTWLDKTHAFMVWEGFKAQGCMSCLHNVWDRPCFHQHSLCNNIVLWAWASWFFTFCCQSSPYHMGSTNHISILNCLHYLCWHFSSFIKQPITVTNYIMSMLLLHGCNSLEGDYCLQNFL